MRDLSGIVKAYDIRGVVGEQLDAAVVRDFGAAFARLVGGPAVVIGHVAGGTSTIRVGAYSSSETPLHLGLYEARPDVDGIAHVHSVHANAVGSLGLPAAAMDHQHGRVRAGAFGLVEETVAALLARPEGLTRMAS